MASRYDPHGIEKKWQEAWEREGTYRAQDAEPATKADKFYGLVEFPYPSGEGLHVGHPRSYTAIDIMTRKRRMEGKNVLFPMGWDAFGLPTENFAIKHKVKPEEATKKNVANFKRQLMSLGFGFDWAREINTTDPAYYKWTQWMFLQFYNSYYDEKTGKARPITELPEAERAGRRMAYKAESTINWCPRCKIGLANEEAQGGVCERCGNGVEQRRKAQWMIRITAYAERLVKDLDDVDYLDRIKAQQINWIGRSEGAYVDFVLEAEGKPLSDKVTVFTTRPDTLYGANYLVLAPEHPLIDAWLTEGDIVNAEEVDAYRESTRRKSDLERQESKDKTGRVLVGIKAINPATGDKIPVWTSDYVLAGYGTGSIMAVPAHDERDLAFAKAFGLPITQVVAPLFIDKGEEPREGKKEVPRNTVICALYDPKNDAYACLEWPKQGWHTLVVGGVEDGEDLVQAGMREVKEETGYKDIRFTRQLGGQFVSRYFAAHKDENRTAYTTCLLYELENEERDEIAESEQVTHQMRWVPASEVEGFLNLTSQRTCMARALHTGPETAFTDDGVAINSGPLDGMRTADAAQAMIAWLEEKGFGSRAITYRLRDWVFSRQRYWGEPIPIIICPSCGYVPVPESQLPVLLPAVEHYEPTENGESPLAAIRDWVDVSCPSCGGKAERETDTMPNWAGSSWYFLRYCDPHNDKTFADTKKLEYWMPVDLYNGGMEHTTLHLLYSRFWYKVLFDLGHIPAVCGSEPYARRRSHAMILGEGGVKMSKSKGNVINPDDEVGRYGADVFRTYEMFIGPFDADAPWDTNGIEGVKRFLEKVWRVFEHGPSDDASLPPEADALLHRTIKKVGEDIEAMRFNTAVSAMMILVNEVTALTALPRPSLEALARILAPFAPHMMEEVWRDTLGHEGSVHKAGWPSYDPSKLASSTFELVIQVDGKVRDKMTVDADISEEDAKAMALASDKVRPFIKGKEVTKAIYVKGRLVNLTT